MPRAFVLPPVDRLPGEFHASAGVGASSRSRTVAPGPGTLEDDERLFGAIPRGPLDAAAVALLGGLPELQALSLADLHLDDDAASGLAHLASLERLSLTRVALTPALVDALARAPALTQLSARGAAVDDAIAGALARLPGLRSLSLVGDGLALELGDPGLAALGALPLEHLEIQAAPKITGVGLGPFGDAARLTSLVLNVCAELSEAAVIEHVARLVRLIYLDLSFNPRLGDPAIAALAGLPALDGLMLRGLGRLGPTGLAALAALPSLRSLHLSTAKKMKRFKASDLDALARARPGLSISRT
ncbi:MAG: hypothetical protein R3B09_27925 [Nannocystaceae bacterium]